MTGIEVRPGTDAGAIAGAVTAALRTIDANIDTYGDRYPADTTAGDRYPLRPPDAGQPLGGNVGWTTSFWPGMLWLAHDLTGDDRYRRAALSHVDSFADRVRDGVDLGTHDLGFLYTLSCVTAATRAGDRRARDAALAAAGHLTTRVLAAAGIIQAWGDLGDPRQRGRTIIDSLMNTPLLYWAGHVSGDERYPAIALRHTVQLREHILRPDGTTFHTFYWDPETGAPLRGETEQGHADDSCWARGQAWAVYGFTLNHRYTGDPSFLAAARTCADYLLAHLPADHVPYWDLVFTDGSGQERDSSAAAIAACGLAELAGSVADPALAETYREAAARILRSLVAGYATGGHPGALIRHGVYDKPKGIGVDEGTLWGDYFYLEALTRAAVPDWTGPW
ncbi:glycoside hydrolase family 88 protein [Phytohabitans sp. ZYX-F-186]|uniref:Glycoside hydrolase family 88 protein n=1 Tax=Phytohabitans maris TaxID=3071409 RepID=A0ABU0ZAK2_9ACTN|nr:glycoside hydrolase family 88 protein [Phytohabitans sp. ZYX-F-186]MDQ7904078.1 glycoside hydrolase family 88 protein [Phytohabitans sp. ZYX-F-186]